VSDPRHALTTPPPISFAPREPLDGRARDIETAVALATHQCAALTADIEATISEAISRLQAAVADAEARLLAVAEQLAT
jgi:hypothetical protein